eukprot:8158270-Pyramimonas_sp.AAC.1
MSSPNVNCWITSTQASEMEASSAAATEGRLSASEVEASSAAAISAGGTFSASVRARDVFGN